jgi:hypothetical protein
VNHRVMCQAPGAPEVMEWVETPLPNPFIMMPHPSVVRARAMPRPMQLVDPVISAFFPFSLAFP